MALPDIDTYDTYGGEKSDYQPVEDPSTDRSSAETNEAFASGSAMTRTAIRAYVVFTVSGGVCTVVEHEAVWGNGFAVAPTVFYNVAGSYQITWPATVTDPRGTTRDVRLRRGWGNVQQNFYTAIVVPAIDPNLMAVNVETGGVLTDPTGAVVVFVL